MAMKWFMAIRIPGIPTELLRYLCLVKAVINKMKNWGSSFNMLVELIMVFHKLIENIKR